MGCLQAGERTLAAVQMREAIRIQDRLAVQDSLQRGVTAGLKGPIVQEALTTMLSLASHEAAQTGDHEMLQAAVEQAESLGPLSPLCALREAIVEARRTLSRLWHAGNAQMLGQRCAICFSDDEPTSVMSCCGRQGSSLCVC